MAAILSRPQCVKCGLLNDQSYCGHEEWMLNDALHCTLSKTRDIQVSVIIPRFE